MTVVNVFVKTGRVFECNKLRGLQPVLQGASSYLWTYKRLGEFPRWFAWSCDGGQAVMLKKLDMGKSQNL